MLVEQEKTRQDRQPHSIFLNGDDSHFVERRCTGFYHEPGTNQGGFFFKSLVLENAMYLVLDEDEEEVYIGSFFFFNCRSCALREEVTLTC